MMNQLKRHLLIPLTVRFTSFLILPHDFVNDPWFQDARDYEIPELFGFAIKAAHVPAKAVVDQHVRDNNSFTCSVERFITYVQRLPVEDGAGHYA
ncbi:hypothetical protein SAMN05444352_1178 [Pseudomonas japonica]|uniref:Uncharacterized protein n=1 Tax=Pseudomonas japonica TaxID=256466 RepID=A0A239I1T4_9PSED|nr:hypothetical protein SAMN05444352_1178 [Pseudomonas japonica]